MTLLERFLKYVSFETTSIEDSKEIPSNPKEKILGLEIVKDLKDMGLENAYMDSYGYVYALLKGNKQNFDSIGLIAHMDTSPDASGKNIHPNIVENYNGECISLKEDRVLDPKEFNSLSHQIGHTLITTDGTTLLGADDKAGVVEIIEAVQYLIQNPNIPHGDIYIGFTPDEEIGSGADHFDLNFFKADYAFTLDGGDPNVLEYENFNAASCKVNFIGKSIHPGSAKNKMVNASKLCIEFDSLLPAWETPEHTENREGFYHLHTMEASVEKATSYYIIRNHDRKLFELQKEKMLQIQNYMNQSYGYPAVKVETKDSYYNMRDLFVEHMDIIEAAKKAIQSVGYIPRIEPIRGGTDGARLSYMGLLCPNLGTGGYNYHGPYEYASLTEMQQCVNITLYLLTHASK